MLESRRFSSPEAFVEAFMATLTPGIVPRANFINWLRIMKKLQHLKPQLEFYAELAKRLRNGADFVQELTDSLLAADDPLPAIRCALELLGHTHSELVTKEDDTTDTELAELYSKGDEHAARYFAELLRELDFEKVLHRENIEDVLLGVQVGLETHHRKNIGGGAFRNEIAALLSQLARQLADKGHTLLLEPEKTIHYGYGLSKKVDFALAHNGQVRFAIEVNFYTVPGSKPTEIKRSYGEIAHELKAIGIELVWITDGKGYRCMKRSLRDAYVVLPNIYNLQQAQQSLLQDLRLALASPD